MALFSLRRSRLRRPRGARLSCARRRSFMAIGGGFHGAPPQVGLALFPRIVAVTFVLWRTVPARHCGAPKPFVGELNEPAPLKVLLKASIVSFPFTILSRSEALTG